CSQVGHFAKECSKAPTSVHVPQADIKELVEPTTPTSELENDMPQADIKELVEPTTPTSELENDQA
ncbi:hypothetical protein V502_00219, partial [Pseudogymnoascus sp. VKM F-4520 (FW-2644)]